MNGAVRVFGGVVNGRGGNVAVRVNAGGIGPQIANPGVGPTTSKEAETALSDARREQEAGNLDRAAALYEQIIEKYRTDTEHASEALSSWVETHRLRRSDAQAAGHYAERAKRYLFDPPALEESLPIGGTTLISPERAVESLLWKSWDESTASRGYQRFNFRLKSVDQIKHLENGNTDVKVTVIVAATTEEGLSYLTIDRSATCTVTMDDGTKKRCKNTFANYYPTRLLGGNGADALTIQLFLDEVPAGCTHLAELSGSINATQAKKVRSADLASRTGETCELDTLTYKVMSCDANEGMTTIDVLVSGDNRKLTGEFGYGPPFVVRDADGQALPWNGSSNITAEGGRFKMTFKGTPQALWCFVVAEISTRTIEFSLKDVALP
jgi:hypothetical protein